MKQTIEWAPMRKRVTSLLIDALTVTILLSLMYYYFIQQYKSTDAMCMCILFAYPTWFLFYSIMESAGGSLGKRFSRIIAVKETSLAEMSFMQSCRRTLIITWPSVILWGIMFYSYFQGGVMNEEWVDHFYISSTTGGWIMSIIFWQTLFWGSFCYSAAGEISSEIIVEKSALINHLLDRRGDIRSKLIVASLPNDSLKRLAKIYKEAAKAK